MRKTSGAPLDRGGGGKDSTSDCGERDFSLSPFFLVFFLFEVLAAIRRVEMKMTMSEKVGENLG